MLVCASTVPRRLILRCCTAVALSVAAAPLAVATSGAAQTPAAQPTADLSQTSGGAGASDTAAPDVPAPSPAQLTEWAEQLGSEQYVQREISSLRLAEAGTAAVPALETAARRGELETTERALQVLQRIGMQQQPDQPSTAWDALRRLAHQTPGSASARANAALQTISQQRAVQARERLSEMGISIGLNEDFPEAYQITAEVCHIPGDWQGRPESLVWLQWLYGIHYALLDGPAVDAQVLARVAKMPDLRNVVLRDAKITAADLQHLADMPRIDQLELRYIEVGDDDLGHIAQLPLRTSLTLNGTRITDQGLQQLREKMPGLQIVYKKGGFLGVTKSGFAGICQISGVVAGGAAEAAGLRADDIITEVDDEQIETFEDLQRVINNRPPGDTLTVVYQRAGTEYSTELTLGQQPTDIHVTPPR